MIKIGEEALNGEEHLWVKLKAPLQSLCTVARLRKLHRKLMHLCALKLSDLLKTPGLLAVSV